MLKNNVIKVFMNNSKYLSTKMLFFISIQFVKMLLSFSGPLFVDFGEVCVQSVCIQKLELMNRLSSFVWVQLEVDCPELQGSSPLSYVVAPHSHNTLPLTFQSNKLGPFIRFMSEAAKQLSVSWD